MATEATATAMVNPIMSHSGVPASAERRAVVHQVRGLHEATISSHREAPLIGKTEPDSSHIGMKTRFMMLWKDEADLQCQANASPSPDMAIEVKPRTASASKIRSGAAVLESNRRDTAPLYRRDRRKRPGKSNHFEI